MTNRFRRAVVANAQVFAWLILSAHIASSAFAQQPSPFPPQDISGVWKSTFGSPAAQRHIREYLTQARALQAKWCGIPWPESEFDRRAKVIAKGLILWEVSKTGGGKAFLRKATNESGEANTVVFAFCAAAQDSMMKCKILCPVNDSACTGGDAYVRLDAQRLYLIAPIRKSDMQCPNKDSRPDEVQYTSPAFLDKQR
jgi:hypothetical protein